MIVDNFKHKVADGKARLSARMVWEDCNRASRILYFETDERYFDALSDSANAFLLSAAVPAMHFGERRLRLEATVCPELNTGLRVALDWFCHWYGGPYDDYFEVETQLQQRPTALDEKRRAAFFFSGGIDSYAALCANHRDFALRHPGRIQDGIVIYGLELDQREKFDYVLKMLQREADVFGLNLIPVFTNIYLIYRPEDRQNGFSFWNDKFHSAALTAAAHALDRRVHTVSLGSTHDIPNLIPHGTHPVIEPNYSSTQLKVKFDGVNLSRFKKTQLVAQWDGVVNNLRVCNHFAKYEADHLNCGVCDKCVRTALALEALGKLRGSRSFPYDCLEVETVQKAFRRLNDTSVRFLPELVEPLQNAGRADLAAAVQGLFRAHKQRQKGRPIYKRVMRPLKNLIKREFFKAA